MTVEVTQGSVTRTATANVGIIPGPIDQVNLEPGESSLDVTGVLKFTARP